MKSTKYIGFDCLFFLKLAHELNCMEFQFFSQVKNLTRTGNYGAQVSMGFDIVKTQLDHIQVKLV